MLLHKSGDYILEATRDQERWNAPGDGPAAWFSHVDGHLLGFGKGETVADACHAALDAWMNDDTLARFTVAHEPTLTAWHALKSALMGSR